MISRIFESRRPVAFCLLAVLLVQLVAPNVAWGLTSGPSQPEFQGFQPAGTTEMVDLFSGDFNYNIPLFELPGPNGGYPFNLSYQAGIGMDQEASWVGLGWSLQPGAINRQMRGLPDEFKGDELITKTSISPNITVGMGAGIGIELFGKDKAVSSIGFSIYNNNYKGLGYSIDANLGFGKANSSGLTAGIGISLDNTEGVGVNPSIGLGGKLGQFGLNAPYNSKSGLSSISLNHSYLKSAKAKKDNSIIMDKLNSSATLSLASQGYTPQVTMPFKSASLSVTLKAGAAWWGAFGAPYVNGFYSEQRLENNKVPIPVKGYGYLNYQYAQTPYDGKAMLDFNREKDGMVTKESPNLGIPSLTYDLYSVTGQGIGMMYRPKRNDYGIVYDQQTESTSNAIGAGLDVGPAASHGGLNLSLNHAKSTSGKWPDGDSDLDEQNKFLFKDNNSLFEPWYFKVHGELTSKSIDQVNAIGGDRAMRLKLKGSASNIQADKILENNYQTTNAPANTPSQSRDSRNQVVSSITNGELVLANGEEILSQYKVDYFDSVGNQQDLIRTGANFPKHHIAGYTALTAEGLRYVYAIPAYNLSQEEVTFSVQKQTGQVSRVNVGDGGNGDPSYTHDGTDNFLRRVQMPKYAHSYLLTSILGPDYVDITSDGVTEDDLGYWVKFTYQKTTDDYRWRDPFSQAHFEEGWRTDPRDDKGTYTYGKKQIWYLRRAETKSHIADFVIQERSDARGVVSKLQDSNSLGKSVYALHEIKLFTRSAGSSAPIKITKFEYDNSLCANVFNGAPGLGKLTLKKIWFEYGSSARGSLNPYEFSYNSNPDYDMHAYDRWGNFKPYPSGQYRSNYDFPYVDQNPDSKQAIDEQASSWSLKEIKLPSGGKIVIDYEADDYAFVQQKQAMQMTEIVEPVNPPTSVLNNNFIINQSNYKIRFKLKKPISAELIPDNDNPKKIAEVIKYLDTQTWQLYFKLYVNLRSPGEDFFEYVNGYADIDKVGGMGLEKDGSGQYVYGYFHVLPEKGKHPFSVRAWQHLRTNQPDLANKDTKLSPASSASEKVKQIKSLTGFGARIRQMFQGFNQFCESKNWGTQVTADASWVRLNSPDKIKFGGGLRVKQITMKDEWALNGEGVYGQVYDYTIQEGATTISSGVAAYEPLVGGDENSLRFAKKYTQSVPLRSDNNLFFEYPINEANYPGAQVGYRKVTVMSLASAALANKPLSPGTDIFPSGSNVSFGTSGMSVHEFYTAKEFPVITDETEKLNKPYKLSVPIPFLGSISVSKLATSQGYSIVTNDMHGKLKKVSNYKQTPAGNFEPQPSSWVQYNYLSDKKVMNGEQVFAVANVLKDNGDETLSVIKPQDGAVAKFQLGQETEFFYDMRQYEDKTWSGGVRTNIDILYLFFVTIPIPAIWPSVGYSTNQLRMAVTNKIIFKTGILESVDAYDEGSLISTVNMKWDKQTGQPILTKVNNNYDNPIFSYTQPAFWLYQGMGAAYKNIGLQFTLWGITPDPYKENLYHFSLNGLLESTLYKGDEIILYPSSVELENPIARVVYIGNVGGNDMFYSTSSFTNTSYIGLISRSGFRNQLGVTTQNIVALSDPTSPTTSIVHSKIIQTPK